MSSPVQKVCSTFQTTIPVVEVVDSGVEEVTVVPVVLVVDSGVVVVTVVPFIHGGISILVWVSYVSDCDGMR